MYVDMNVCLRSVHERKKRRFERPCCLCPHKQGRQREERECVYVCMCMRMCVCA